MPRVIIGSPLFNHAKDFREAIESILGQTFTDFALVLVDDCSNDETPHIAKEYVALDSRVSYQVNAQRLGLVAPALAPGIGRRARSTSGRRARVSAQSTHRAVGGSPRSEAMGLRHLRHD